jgi:hypothetical protein
MASLETGSPHLGGRRVSLGSEAGRPVQFSKNLQLYFLNAPFLAAERVCHKV